MTWGKHCLRRAPIFFYLVFVCAFFSTHRFLQTNTISLNIRSINQSIQLIQRNKTDKNMTLITLVPLNPPCRVVRSFIHSSIRLIIHFPFPFPFIHSLSGGVYLLFFFFSSPFPSSVKFLLRTPYMYTGTMNLTSIQAKLPKLNQSPRTSSNTSKI